MITPVKGYKTVWVVTDYWLDFDTKDVLHLHGSLWFSTLEQVYKYCYWIKHSNLVTPGVYKDNQAITVVATATVDEHFQDMDFVPENY